MKLKEEISINLSEFFSKYKICYDKMKVKRR